jgi:hypothetical protein
MLLFSLHHIVDLLDQVIMFHSYGSIAYGSIAYVSNAYVSIAYGSIAYVSIAYGSIAYVSIARAAHAVVLAAAFCGDDGAQDHVVAAIRTAVDLADDSTAHAQAVSSACLQKLGSGGFFFVGV